jgi:hypothetical protein
VEPEEWKRATFLLSSGRLCFIDIAASILVLPAPLMRLQQQVLFIRFAIVTSSILFRVVNLRVLNERMLFLPFNLFGCLHWLVMAFLRFVRENHYDDRGVSLHLRDVFVIFKACALERDSRSYYYY